MGKSNESAGYARLLSDGTPIGDIVPILAGMMVADSQVRSSSAS